MRANPPSVEERAVSLDQPVPPVSLVLTVPTEGMYTFPPAHSEHVTEQGDREPGSHLTPPISRNNALEGVGRSR